MSIDAEKALDVQEADRLKTRWGRLELVGKRLYGDRWSGRMAAELGVHRSMPAKIARGEKRMSDVLERRFEALVKRKTEELEADIRSLRFVALQISRDVHREMDEIARAKDDYRGEDV